MPCQNLKSTIDDLNIFLLQPSFWQDPKSAIKTAYFSTNKHILENSKQLGHGGSTAVTAIVIDGKDLWIANIGDSRAVVSERGAANQLTVDHEPHADSERSRIESQGGFVIAFPGRFPNNIPIFIWLILLSINFIIRMVVVLMLLIVNR